MEKSDAVLRVEAALEKFVPYIDWRDSTGGSTGPNETLLYNERGGFTLFEHAQGAMSLDGVVGGWCMAAVVAAGLLAGAKQIKHDDAMAFCRWYWKQSGENEKASELTRLREGARRLGYNLVPRN